MCIPLVVLLLLWFITDTAYLVAWDFTLFRSFRLKEALSLPQPVTGTGWHSGWVCWPGSSSTNRRSTIGQLPFLMLSSLPERYGALLFVYLHFASVITNRIRTTGMHGSSDVCSPFAAFPTGHVKHAICVCVIPHANSSCFFRQTKRTKPRQEFRKCLMGNFGMLFEVLCCFLLLRCQTRRGLSPVCNPLKVLVTKQYSSNVNEFCSQTVFTFGHECNLWWPFVDDACIVGITTKLWPLPTKFFLLCLRSDDVLSTVFLPHASTLQPSLRSQLM